jgi:transposase InsO family protein
MPAPPLAPRPNRLGLGPERGGFLAAIERFEGVYNRRRRHSALGFLTPAQAYAQMARAA